MVIKSLELENVGPFRFHSAANDASDGKVCIEFDNHVNLFIGPNNTGKSTILQAVDLLTERWTVDFSNRYLKTVGFSDDFARVAMLWHNGQNQRLRFRSSYHVLSAVMRKMTTAAAPPGFAYAPAHILVPRQSPVQAVEMEQVGTIQHLDLGTPQEVSYADWSRHKREDFGYVGYATHTDHSQHDAQSFATYSRAHNEFEHDVFRTMQQIISQITQGFPMLLGVNNFASSQATIVADQTPDGRVSIDDLSLGTRYILAWIVQFVDNFARRYKDIPNWQDMPGIFIIDEIDAHLHPSWQRRLIPTLTRHFPNVQIFASTHSPMMVAGLKAGQVHLLKRDETGRVVWSRNEQDIIGWTADEIYRTFMGIDDPTDELTVQRANRLRELRDKIPRTEAEEEELQNLRRQVNQDLLAGGHINAQRERYASLMELFLCSRMADLSQDGA